MQAPMLAPISSMMPSDARASHRPLSLSHMRTNLPQSCQRPLSRIASEITSGAGARQSGCSSSMPSPPRMRSLDEFAQRVDGRGLGHRGSCGRHALQP